MISRKEIEYLARLARIELAETEKVKFEKDLSGILDFVAKLDEVDTADTAPLAGGTDLSNVMREDEVGNAVEAASREELVNAAPEKERGFVKVKAVFDRE